MPEISGLYLQREEGGREERRGEEKKKGSGKGKSICHWIFVVLIRKMIDY